MIPQVQNKHPFQSIYYKGNRNLRRAGVSLEFNQHEFDEFVKCSQDPMYFFQKYVKIVHVDRGLIPFLPYEYQKKIAKTIFDNRYTVVKLPRQSGKSTVVAAILLWYILFNENYNIAILANKEASAKGVLRRIKLAFQNLPTWLQQGIVDGGWNKNSIELENGSVINAMATSADAGRGDSINLVYLDEFAIVDTNIQEDFFSSVFPTISSGETTKVVITSTPKGMNYFYKIWVDSEQGRNEFKRVDIHWSETPGRDEKWKVEMIKSIGNEKFSQEFETEFLGSSSTLINGAKLRMLTYIAATSENENFKVYSDPVKTSQYVITVDPSEGNGGDYSAFVVFDVTQLPYKVVARYRNNRISPLLFPSIIYETAKRYNDAFVLIETNINPQVADILYRDLEYENVIMSASRGRRGIIATSNYASKTSLGVKTTKTTKSIGCATFKTLVESDKFIVNDFDILNEMSRFVFMKNSYMAEQGNDDLVMCCVLFSWLSDQDFFKDITDIDIRKNMMQENKDHIEERMIPVGFMDDGEVFFDENQDVIDIGSGDIDEWLLTG